MIRYEESPELNSVIKEIVELLGFKHIHTERVFCFKSRGSSSRNVVARCHSLPVLLQKALKTEPAYVIEVISEKFDKLSDEEKIKILIHELLHIPKSFKGGFLHHNFVKEREVKKLFQKFKDLKAKNLGFSINDSIVGDRKV
ncbi:MAG: putative metallopeptidase [Candidatus Pacearchaeota archaeon]